MLHGGGIAGPGAARPGADLPLGDPGAARERHDPGVPGAVGRRVRDVVDVPADPVPVAPPGRDVLLRRRRRRADLEAALLPAAGRVAVCGLRAAALAQRPAKSAAAAAVDMPVPPDDSEACAGAADRALRAEGRRCLARRAPTGRATWRSATAG